MCGTFGSDDNDGGGGGGCSWILGGVRRVWKLLCLGRGHVIDPTCACPGPKGHDGSPDPVVALTTRRLRDRYCLLPRLPRCSDDDGEEGDVTRQNAV